MDYFKKTLILKQIQDGFSTQGKVASGIARLEIESGVSTLFLTLINLAPVSEGSFVAFINDRNGLLLSVDLGKSPLSITKTLPTAPEIDRDLSVGVSYIKDGIPLLIVYANSENRSDLTYFKKQIIDKCIAEKKFVELPTSTIAKDAGNLNPDTEYNDEIVATENYFLKDGDLEQKLQTAEKLDNELLWNKNVFTDSRSQAETIENQKNVNGGKDEKNFDSCQSYSEQNPYFRTVKRELEEIFSSFPEETSLNKTLPNSKWVKIFYSQTKYYVVGIVYENKHKEKYVCYGVPAKYSLSPP